MKNIGFRISSAALMFLSIAVAGQPIAVVPIVADNWGLRIATSAWIAGTGVPAQNGDVNDVGLVMQKNGPTSADTTPYAEVTNVKGIPADTITLGFDYKNGQDCTASSPSFLLYTSDKETHHYIRCSGGTHLQGVPIPGWNRATFTALDSVLPIAPGTSVTALYIMFTDGIDTAGVQTPGTVTLDNIRVNSTIVTSTSSNSNGNSKK